MMLEHTEQITLKKFVHTIGSEEKIRNESRQARKSIRLGGQKIGAGAQPIPKLQERFGVAPWFVSHVSDAEKKNPLPIMRTTISLLKLLGSANRATSSVTKN